MIARREVGWLGRVARATCVFVSFTLLGACAQAGAARTQYPIVYRTVILKAAAQPDFFRDLAKFADSEAFAVWVGHPTPDREHVLVQMWREDMKIILTNPFDPNRFGIAFYRNGDFPVFKSDFDRMMAGLLNAAGPAVGSVE